MARPQLQSPQLDYRHQSCCRLPLTTSFRPLPFPHLQHPFTMYQLQSPASVSSTSSLQSILSDDSYLEKFKPVDAGFIAMLKEVNALDSNRSVLAERKAQSHIQKRRDQTDNATREAWTEKQVKDYELYKSLVVNLSTANKTAAASSKVAKTRGDEDSCKKALADQKARSNAAIRYVQGGLEEMIVIGASTDFVS